MVKELSKSGYDGPPIRGPEYLMPHACFACRKSWKLPAESTAKCPECGGGLADMGRHFRVPKKRDKDGWVLAEKLWTAGYRFWSTRNWDAEPYPTDHRDVEDWIAANPDHRKRIGPDLRHQD